MDYLEWLLSAWLMAGFMIVIVGTWADPGASWREFLDGGGIIIFVLAIIVWPLALWAMVRDDN
jgi:hypothetical protein